MLDTTWGCNDFTSMNLQNLEAALTATYTYPLTQISSAVISNDSVTTSNHTFSPSLSETSPVSRYVPFDLDRANVDLVLSVGKASSVTNDAKEGAKEVSKSRPVA